LNYRGVYKLKNIINKKQVQEEVAFHEKSCSYCSGIECPICYSHYLRDPDYKEKLSYKKLHKLENIKKSLAVCEECSHIFTEEEGVYLYDDIEEDYYDLRDNYATSEVYEY
tara:strand:- start:503 stop:835 length:333 start_codon:yes stop_codon:yes gene_type:complete